jgi:hypothetical protein
LVVVVIIELKFQKQLCVRKIEETMSLLESLPTFVEKKLKEAEPSPTQIVKVKVRTKSYMKPAVSNATEDVCDSEQRNTADNLARINIAYQMAMDMKKRNSDAANIDSASTVDGNDEDAPLHQRFKKHIGVDAGSSLRRVQKEIAEKNPDMPLSTVKAKAVTELKREEKIDNRLQWTSNPPDSIITPILRIDPAPEAAKLVRDFEDKSAALNSKTEAELAMANSINKLRRDDRQRTQKTAQIVFAKAESIINNTEPAAVVEDASSDVAPADFNITDRSKLFAAPIVEEKKTVSPSGLVVARNNFGDVVESDVHSMAQFAAMFSSAKTKSEDTLTSDAARFMDRFHTQTVNQFMKLLDSAPSDACLTAKGQRPSGSMAVDMRRLFEDSGFDASSLSNERLIKYHSLWQQTHTATPADTENALVIRVKNINREKARDTLRKINVSESGIELILAHSANVEYTEFFRCVYNSVSTFGFLRAEEQAEIDTALADRISAETKRALKEQNAKSNTSSSGNRGKEALGMKTSKQSPQTTAKLLGISMEEVDIPYIEDFLRPPIFDGERPCQREESCLCVVLASTFPIIRAPDGKGSAFVAREFLLPSQKSTFDTHRKLPDYRYMCFVCEVAAVEAAVSNHVENHKEPTLPLHRFVVKQDCQGGFRRELLLSPLVCENRFTGIVGPFPALNVQNLAFCQVVLNNTKYNCITLTGAAFRTGSASNQRI